MLGSEQHCTDDLTTICLNFQFFVPLFISYPRPLMVLKLAIFSSVRIERFGPIFRKEKEMKHLLTLSV